jgi:hypothetical protein
MIGGSRVWTALPVPASHSLSGKFLLASNLEHPVWPLPSLKQRTVNVGCRLITDSIQDMAKTSGLTTEFLSIVLLPLAGNAVEHITAVMVAMKNKMDLALGIAIGSSIQIALFVLPTCVLFSWAIHNPFTLQLDALGADIPNVLNHR